MPVVGAQEELSRLDSACRLHHSLPVGVWGGSSRGGRRWSEGAAGLLAAAVALAMSELADAVLAPVPSLLTVVGQAFIRAAPARFGRAAIETVGRSDKPLVVAGTVVVALCVGTLVGLMALRRPVAGDIAFAALAGLAVACATRLPPTSVAGTAVGAVVAGVVGASALRLLLRPLAEAIPLPATVDADAPVLLPGAGASRRRFLSVATAVGGTAGLALLGAWGVRRTDVAAAPKVAVRFPTPVSPASPAAAEVFEVEGLSPLVTPTGQFFRIDEALVAPVVDAGSWRLRITGMVDTPLELTYDDLVAEDLIERHITLACVSAEVGGPLVGNSRWLGARLGDLLRRAGVQAGATQVVGRSVDGFTAGFPTEVAMDGRDALVALAMDGLPLSRDHGYPARLVVPGLYGFLSATKWLKQIELTTWEAFDAYWVQRGWADRAPVKVQSRIDVPRGYGRVAAGRRPIAGVAWAPTRGIAAVEVQVDGGPWKAARLGPALGDDAWRQWTSEWTATHGHHEIVVRATTNDGEVQTAEKHAAFPNGASGRHKVEVWVPD